MSSRSSAAAPRWSCSASELAERSGLPVRGWRHRGGGAGQRPRAGTRARSLGEPPRGARWLRCRPDGLEAEGDRGGGLRRRLLWRSSAIASAAQDVASPTPVQDLYEAPGPYAVRHDIEPDPAEQSGYELFTPADLGPDGTRHPVITWGNGSFARPAEYAPTLRHLASWGFIVVAAGTDQAGTGQEMLAAVRTRHPLRGRPRQPPVPPRRPRPGRRSRPLAGRRRRGERRHRRQQPDHHHRHVRPAQQGLRVPARHEGVLARGDHRAGPVPQRRERPGHLRHVDQPGLLCVGPGRGRHGPAHRR